MFDTGICTIEARASSSSVIESERSKPEVGQWFWVNDREDGVWPGDEEDRRVHDTM